MSRKDRLIDEWNKIAKDRYEDLRTQSDISYEEVLKPSLDTYLSNCNLEKVLDVGCGVGIYTNHLARNAKSVVGIDISDVSISYANMDKQTNTTFYSISLEDYNPSEKFTTIISNMTLMDMENLDSLFSKFYDLLEHEGSFVFTITHPVYWPIYWGYDKIEEFDYQKELEVCEVFKTRNKIYNGLKTTHFNRPLTFYLKGLIKTGFHLEDFDELFDNSRAVPKYPRFIIIKCTK